MITKELIRAKIERLKSKYRHNGLWSSSLQSDLAMAKIESMNELLSFLNTLSDKPIMDCKNLTEAAEEYTDYNFRRWQEDGDIYYDRSKIKDAFLAGAEWQKKQEQSDVELEKEIEHYLLDNASLFIHADSKTVVQALARHFYEFGLNAGK